MRERMFWDAKLPGSDHYGCQTLQQCRGWWVDNALHKKRGEKPGYITLRLQRGPYPATRTHCLCRQADIGHHDHLSSMHLPHTRKKNKQKNKWFSQSRMRVPGSQVKGGISAFRSSYTITFHKLSHLYWLLGR